MTHVTLYAVGPALVPESAVPPGRASGAGAAAGSTAVGRHFASCASARARSADRAAKLAP